MQTQGILAEGTVIVSQRQGQTYQKFKYASTKWLEKNKANEQKKMRPNTSQSFQCQATDPLSVHQQFTFTFPGSSKHLGHSYWSQRNKH